MKEARVAVKVTLDEARKIEEILREAGLVEIADRYLAKYEVKEKTPREVNVRNESDLYQFDKVPSLRIDLEDLRVGDEIVDLNGFRYKVKEIEGEVVTLTRKSLKRGKISEKKMIAKRYTKLLDEPKINIEDEAPKNEEVVEEVKEEPTIDPYRKIEGESAKDRKNRIRREKRALAKSA